MQEVSDYQVMPPLSDEEYVALKADIAARGVQVPVEYDEQGNVLDGYHRVRACEELGVKDWPSVVRVGLSEQQKVEHAILLNLARRQVSREWKREKAAELRRQGWTQARIADVLGVTQAAVSQWCSDPEFIRTYKLDSLPPAIVGKDGKEYPATRERRQSPESSSSVFLPSVKQVERVAEIAERTPDALDALAAGRMTIGAACKEMERAERREQAVKASLPTDKYRILYADPPWKYGNSMPAYFGEQADHYPLMALEEICAMPVKDIAEDNAVLFLWATSPILEEAFDVIRAWGFQYKASFVWDKVKHVMGHYNSVRHEFLLVATRGSCQPDVQRLFDSVVSIERTEHSVKPEHFREIIDTLYTHGKRIELFARQRTEGWDCYGNELPELSRQ